jgi:hypothetical protein
MVSARHIPAAKHENRVEGKVERCGSAGQHEQADLGGGVEPEAEQHTDRVDVPRLADALRQAAQEPVQEAPLVEVVLQLGLVVPALSHLAKDPHDPEQDHEVQDPEDPQEDPGDRGADDAGRRVQRRVVVLDRVGERLDARGEQEREPEHDRGVSKREPEAD